MLAASCVLCLAQVVVSSHATSLQRGYRWTASSRDAQVPPLTGGRRTPGESASEPGRNISGICGSSASGPCARPQRHPERMGSRPLFLGQTGLRSALRYGRSLATFDGMEYRVCRHCSSFSCDNLALAMVSE